ncbi:MAG TPA: AraC family transcriptional regulator, partial [Planctomycetota bacterium]|nr:AraC family transcriptional regulator [Planctomycetota bacterium]
MIERPASRTDRPAEAKSVDPLSAVFRAVRLRGAVYFLVDASPPWLAQAPAGRQLAPTVMPGAQHLIEYHVVKRGSCYGGLLGERTIALGAGDVLVFPHGDAHVMSSSPNPRPGKPDNQDVDRLLARASPPFPIRTGGGGEASHEVVCGFLGCDIRPFNPLIATLPRVLHVPADTANTHLNALVALTLAESGERRAGSECMLARLSELMFIEVVRLHLQTLPPGNEGWLAGLRDPVVGRALSLLHGEPARAWTLESLAQAASVSRSALAERFRQFTGQPPMQYLAQWRMQIAAGLLAESNASVAAVAFDVGYGSEAAFSRAFKKLVGASPSAWRTRG